MPEEFALVQMGSRVRLSGDCCGELDGRDGECGDDTGSDVETRVPDPIEQLGGRLHRMAQVELVYRADPDSHVEIRGEIGDMIAELPRKLPKKPSGRLTAMRKSSDSRPKGTSSRTSSTR